MRELADIFASVCPWGGIIVNGVLYSGIGTATIDGHTVPTLER